MSLFPNNSVRQLVVLFALLVVKLFLLGNPAFAQSKAETPTVSQGVMEAPNWSFDSQSPLEIKGQWEVIWGRLVSPQEFDDAYQGELFELPARWNKVNHDLMQGALGVATFRARLKLPQHKNEVAYHMIAAHSAYRIYIDGGLVVSNGIVSETESGFKANYVSRSFPGVSGESEIVMQAANFTHAYGGPGHALKLWDARRLERSLDTFSIVYGLVVGIMFTIGLFHLILYSADRQSPDSDIHLWFSVLCFIIVYRVQGIVPLLHQYFPNSDYWADLRFAYASLYAAPAAYLLFFRAVFKEHFPKRLTYTIITIALLGLVFTLLSSEFLYSSTRNFSIWLNVFVIAYSLLFTSLAVVGRERGARVILVSNFIFLVTAIYDAVIYTDRSSGFDMTPFGILALGLGYSYALFLRLQTTFRKARETSNALEALNLNLEKQVSDRTDEFRAAAAKAENAAGEKARFIAAASHDLRQPLHALALFNRTLKHKLFESPEAELLSRQENAINSLATLLQDTLDAARLDGLEKRLNPNDVSTDMLSQKLVDSFSPLAKSQNVNLSVESEKGVLRTDTAMLQRVLSNLIDNALKAAKSDVEVTLSLGDDNCWCFAISDDGAGIPNEDLDRIFNSYVSLQTPHSNQTGGYGLGLYVVKEFSKALGAEIYVESSHLGGACFKLKLPASATLCRVDANQAVGDREIGALAGLKVLAIDDDQEILEAIESLLTAWRCDVAVANTANDAERALINFQPDVALIDYHLGGGTGIELKKQLDECGLSNVPTIIVTGATELSILDQIHSAGFRLLEKPVNPDALADAIAMATQRLTPAPP